jgi:hypothetical protein
MPNTFPAAPPTLSGDTVSISRFLQSPTALQRRLRNYADLRFVADQLLTQRFRSQGGAVLYEQSEPFVTDRAVESVAPGSAYPYANLPTGTAAIAAIQKWGQKVFLSDEEIARNVYQGASADRALRKVVNSVIKQVDGIAMSAISSAVTQTSGASAAWNGGSAKFLQDVLLARSVIVGLNLGYKPDTLALNDAQYAYLMSDQTITNALRRETTANPIYSGQIDQIAGLTIIVSPAIAANGAMVLDSTQLGGMADEMDGAPGYAVSDLAVQVKSIRLEGQDGYDLQGRRKTVPVVQEPGAAVKITGTTI